MPMLSPTDTEDRAAFVARFMSDPEMIADYPSQKQRLGVAYAAWRSAGHSAPRKSVLKRYS